jgi:hypothetical protein
MASDADPQSSNRRSSHFDDAVQEASLITSDVIYSSSIYAFFEASRTTSENAVAVAFDTQSVPVSTGPAPLSASPTSSSSSGSSSQSSSTPQSQPMIALYSAIGSCFVVGAGVMFMRRRGKAADAGGDPNVVGGFEQSGDNPRFDNSKTEFFNPLYDNNVLD